MPFPSVGTVGVAASAAAQSDSFDLETALMAVQQGRIRNLDEQLQAQIEGIQASNARATKLNEVYKDINSMIDKFGSETNPKKTRQWSKEEVQKMDAALADLGIDGGTLFGPRLANFGYSAVTLSDFKTAAATIKGQIDTNSNTQQMDMLRLQSLTNKRNEAFETMSSVMKKIQDANSSILNRI